MNFDEEFYEEKSWGSVAIEESKDLPTLKLRYLLQLLQRRKKKTVSLLELGSGSGRILASLKKYDKHLKLTGVDISKKQVELAKRDNPDIAFKVGNVEKLPFTANSFDYVVFLDVIEHVEHPDKLLKEAARVLKPGGHLYGVSPCEGKGIYKLSTTLIGWHIKEETAGHIQQFTVRDLLQRVKKSGLKIQDVKYSYHLLGSIMDYTMFTLLLNKNIAKLFWQKNKYYKNKKTKQSLPSKVMNSCLTLANGVAYYESHLLKDTEATATGVHITARKP